MGGGVDGPEGCALEIKGSADANGGKHVMIHPELLIAALTPGQRQ